jgi:hypothetical protein
MSAKQHSLTVFFVFVLLMLGLSRPAAAQDVASELLARINALRASLGLPGYSLNGALSAAALNQARWMVNTGQISHTQSDGSTPSSRAAAAGYGGSWVSENIYGGSLARIDDAWAFWTTSPIHYRGLTNPNYQDIGIASATSSWGTAYVLVFGAQGSGRAVSTGGGSSGGTGRASGPPPFVVGLDNHGNIMHEVQPQQTIGDILLIYGYTWDDLGYFLTLNHKSQDDIRRLQIGEVVLVPPKAGTYTPTPLPEGWPTATLLPDELVATAIAEAVDYATLVAQSATPTPPVSPTPQPTVTVAPLIVTETPPARIATAADVPAVLFTITPATATPSPTLDITLTRVASVPVGTPAPILADVPAPPASGPDIPWVWVAVGLQVGVALMAGLQFLMRRRK